MDSHSVYGGSSAERYVNCPGSVSLIRATPAADLAGDTKYSIEGNKAHAALEHFTKEYDPTPDNLEKYFVRFCVTDTELQHSLRVVIEVVDYIRATRPDTRFSFEKTVYLSFKHLAEPVNSRVDVCMYCPHTKELFVIDFKYGAGIAVGVHKNYQLLFYGLGVWYSDVFGKAIEVDHVHLGIIQPRAFQAKGPVQFWSLPPSELLAYYGVFHDAIEKTLNPEAELNPNIKWCRFCPVGFKCPALRTVVATTTGNLPETITKENLPSVDKAHVAQLAAWLDAADLITTWVKHVKAQAMRRLFSGKPIPGWELGRAEPRRSWSGDPAVIGNALADKFGVPVETMMPRKLLTITETEDLIKRIAKSQALTRSARLKMEAELNAHITKLATGDFFLKPASDERPAVNPADFFRNVKK